MLRENRLTSGIGQHRDCQNPTGALRGFHARILDRISSCIDLPLLLHYSARSPTALQLSIGSGRNVRLSCTSGTP